MDNFEQVYNIFLKDVNDSDLDKDFIDFVNNNLLDILIYGFKKESDNV